MIRLLADAIFCFITKWIPIMIFGFIVFTVAFYYLGHSLSEQKEIEDAFQESGASQVFICQSPEDCERVRSGD